MDVERTEARSRVALVREADRFHAVLRRFHAVLRSLELVEADVDLGGVRRLLVKPNFVSTTQHLAATHVDATRALLTWLRRHYGGPIVVGFGTLAISPWWKSSASSCRT